MAKKGNPLVLLALAKLLDDEMEKEKKNVKGGKGVKTVKDNSSSQDENAERGSEIKGFEGWY